VHISNETLSQVQQRVSIEEVASDFLTLKKKGHTLWALCPFHHEKTPSFSISPDKGFYKCFGCNAKGDAIKFIMEIEHLNFQEAIIWLAKKYGITVKQNKETHNEQFINQHNHKESIYILNDKAKNYYSSNLFDPTIGKEAVNYLKQRKIDSNSIQQFELGYSTNQKDSLYKFAQTQGYQADILLEAGLIHKNEEKFYDRFIDRIIFPIHNLSGNIVAFAGRNFNSLSQAAKYINSPETITYKKSNLLYGLYHAKNHIKKHDLCYIVEGYTDVIALHQNGINNTVASGGTAFTFEQIMLIKRFTNNITILFDGDTAGIKASIESIDKILEQNMNVNIILLPEGEDPDSYANKLNSSQLINYLETNKKDFIKFKADLLLKNIKGDIGKKSQAISSIIQSIAAIPNPIKRALFIKELSEELDLSENAINQALEDMVNKNKTYKTQSISPLKKTPIDKQDTSKHEKEILYLLLNYGNKVLSNGIQLAKYIFTEIQEINFRTPGYNQILQTYNELLHDTEAIDIKNFVAKQPEEIQNIIIDCLASPYVLSKNW
jgi:DNA primase